MYVKPFFGGAQNRKIPHTGDKASLDRCGQQHRCHRRVDQEYPETHFFGKTEKSSKTQKLKNVQKQAKISDTPFNQRSLIHREAWFPSEPRIPKNPIFLKNGKKSSKMQKLKNVQRYGKISDTPFDQRSLIHREAWFPGGPRIPKNPIFLKNGKNLPKRSAAQRFQTTFKQKCSNIRPLLSITFPQGFRISKNIGHPTSGSGGKKTVKRYLKSEQTKTQTDGQTNTQTDGHFNLQKASAQRADALKKMHFILGIGCLSKHEIIFKLFYFGYQKCNKKMGKNTCIPK